MLVEVLHSANKHVVLALAHAIILWDILHAVLYFVQEIALSVTEEAIRCLLRHAGFEMKKSPAQGFFSKKPGFTGRL